MWAEDSGGDGPPIVLVHPGWGDSRIWDPVVESLEQSVRVIRYDMRGYHRSPVPREPFTQLGDLRAVLDHFAVPTAVVVGHSGGGAAAISLALADPDRVRALVLLAPGVADYPWPMDDPYFAEFGRLLTAGDRDGMVELGVRTWASGGDDPAVREQLRSAATAFFADHEYERPDPPAFDRLGELVVPCTVLIGTRDYPMVAECAETVASRIPGCRIVSIPDADHMVPLRAPDLVAGHVSRYLG